MNCLALSIESDLVSKEGSLIEHDVLFLGFVNNRGRLESSSSKSSLNLTDQRMEMFLMGTSLQSSLQKDFDEDFGQVDYCLVRRENLKFVSIPLQSGILLGVIPCSSNHDSFVDSIRTILNSKNSENRRK